MGATALAAAARRLYAIRAVMTAPSREAAVDIAHAAFLIIDLQNYCAHPDGGWWRHRDPASDFFDSLSGTVLPNIRRLQTLCRQRSIEVLFSVIENLTRDGRDRSLDYRISGIDVAPASWDAQVLDNIASAQDEMIFRKTSSNVFISTNIDYVLRNLGVRSLIIAGVMTDQCVESAVRDACDLGYLVTLVTDACTTGSAERHRQALVGLAGYCRQRSTAALLAELAPFANA
jgi:ureidoacrylate peracid hydrolase